jgi:copper(I)-binding protein
VSAGGGRGGRAATRELARAAAMPAAAAAAVLVLLAAWVAIGGAGTISRVQLRVTRADLPASASPAGTTAPYLTIRNFSGRAYRLTAASSPGVRAVTVPGGLVIPAHATVSFSRFGRDIELAGLRRPRAGGLVPLTLVFGTAGRVTVEATVTAAGVP